MATKVFIDGAEVFNKQVTIVSGQLTSVADRVTPASGNYVQLDNVVTVDGAVVPGGIVTIRGYNCVVDVPDHVTIVTDQTDSVSVAEDQVLEAQVVQTEDMDDTKPPELQ